MAFSKKIDLDSGKSDSMVKEIVTNGTRVSALCKLRKKYMFKEAEGVLSVGE
jgi:hypothetical protein